MAGDVFRDGVAEVVLEANSCSEISFGDRLRTGEHPLWYRVKGGLSSKLSKKNPSGNGILQVGWRIVGMLGKPLGKNEVIVSVELTFTGIIERYCCKASTKSSAIS